jgi:hypothetical protein
LGDSARLSGSGSGAGVERLLPLKGRKVSTDDVGDRGSEGGGRGGMMETEKAESVGAVATLVL